MILQIFQWFHLIWAILSSDQNPQACCKHPQPPEVNKERIQTNIHGMMMIYYSDKAVLFIRRY